MPKKGYKQTKQHIENHRKTLKGKTYEEIVGIKKAKEWKKKQHKSSIKKWQDSKKRDKASKRMKGDKNPAKRPEVRKKLSKSLIKRWQNPKERKKFSERMEGDKNPVKKLVVKKKISKGLKKYHRLNPSKSWLCKKGRVAWNKGLIGYLAGPKHWNWKNAKSSESYPPEFSFIRKFFVKQGFNFQCQLCYETYPYPSPKLGIHHIDYNKKNNDIDNWIPLCRSCHTKTNYNREYWQKYFENYIRNILKYGNVYYRSNTSISQG